MKLTKEEKEVIKEFPLWKRPFIILRGLFRVRGLK